MFLTTLLCLFECAWHLAGALCFVPNGTERTQADAGQGYVYEPCKTGSHSMCCNTSTNDTCHEDGLCWNEDGRFLWRESCTDPTWQSPECLKLCIGDDPMSETDEREMSGTDVKVSKCADGLYCCGNGEWTKDCCDRGKGFRIENGQVVTTISTSYVPSTIPIMSQTATDKTSIDTSPTETRRDRNMEDDDGNHANLAVIGGAVGGSIGGILVVATISGIIVFRRRRKEKPGDEIKPAELDIPSLAYDMPEAQSRSVFEADSPECGLWESWQHK